MSQNQITPQEPRRVIFVGRSGTTAQEVLGTDPQTGQGFILIGAPGNTIIRVLINDAAAPFDIILKRDGKEVRRWPSSLLNAVLPGPLWPGFPLPVRPGQIQFYAEQKGSAVGEDISIDVIWVTSLISVTS